ncbi:MAG TPA: hypothetical protein VK727_10510, partial [Steroidobacteraceae bacterium]|nr:hypothetical protein [Steroidobacteraceae bacterium]
SVLAKRREKKGVEFGPKRGLCHCGLHVKLDFSGKPYHGWRGPVSAVAHLGVGSRSDRDHR